MLNDPNRNPYDLLADEGDENSDTVETNQRNGMSNGYNSDSGRRNYRGMLK